jgi:casein kinase II subunit alpha
VRIAKVLGTDELFAYVNKYQLQLDPHYDDILGQHPRKPWSKFFTPQNEQLVTDEALDLLNKMLRYDHAERITPRDAMNHPYFKPIRDHHAKNYNN